MFDPNESEYWLERARHTSGNFVTDGGLDLEAFWLLMGRPVEIEGFRYRLEKRWAGTGLPPS